MTKLASVILVLVCQIGLSEQACAECTCCKGSFNCDSNKNCVGGCIDGYYGNKCTEECLENCKTCFNGYECTECKPGYYTGICNLQCGKGCVNSTCLKFSGECLCKSTDFKKGKCDACIGLMYGDECNNTCPSNCGTCTSETECSWCKFNVYYGSYCQYRCPFGCYGGKCNKGTGNCTGGCKSGFSGGKCDICSPGLFGTNCHDNCTEHCSTCISENNCTTCTSGYYGILCANTCPYGCNGSCSLNDGKCFDCKSGFWGEFCDTCEDGTYGVNCSKYCRDIDTHCQVCSTNESGSFETCSKCNSGYYPVVQFGFISMCVKCPNNCNDNICDTAGSCENGCILGKWGETCNNSCPSSCSSCISATECSSCKNNAYYGPYCQYRCSHGCNRGTCYRDTEYCTNGCKSNFRGNKCDICSPGLYGTFCDLTCPENCSSCISKSNDCSRNCSTSCNFTDNGLICERDTGGCLHGCKSSITYGDYCEKLCSDTCNNNSCDWKSGHCSKGCSINYYGPFCNKTCTTSCLPNGTKRVCDEKMGNCLYGCIDGFHGSRCDNKCSNQCVNSTCNQITAECVYGCVDGFKGPSCAEAIILDLEGYYTRSTLIGSTIGTFLAGGIVVGIASLITFIVWKRRNILTKQLDVHGYENTIGPCGNRSNDNKHENESPVTYEDLKSRDERLYSQITTSQQISSSATDYVNYSS